MRDNATRRAGRTYAYTVIPYVPCCIRRRNGTLCKSRTSVDFVLISLSPIRYLVFAVVEDPPPFYLATTR